MDEKKDSNENLLKDELGLTKQIPEYVPRYRRIKKKTKDVFVAKKEDLSLCFCSLLLGIVFVILFYDKTLGVSYFIFVILLYTLFLWKLKKDIVFKWSFGWFLTIPILALSLTYFLFLNPTLRVFNYIFIPILIIAQAVLITGLSEYKWFDVRFLSEIGFSLVDRTFNYIGKFFKVAFYSFKKTSKNKTLDVIKKIFIGLLISIPLLLIVIPLLASADQVFYSLVEDFMIWIENFDFETLINQILLAILASMILFSHIWSYSKKIRNTSIDYRENKKSKKFEIDPVITLTVLSIFNALFLVFIVIQFAYLFNGTNQALPEGYTYAEYARKGFFELVVVTIINLVFMLISIHLKPKTTKKMDVSLKTMLTILVLSTMVLLISAFLRMNLYELAYGFTFLRIVVQIFMILLFVLFTITLVKVWNAKCSLLKAYIITTLVFYLALNFMNIDLFIAQNNIERFDNTGEIDYRYLDSLSFDAAPSIIEYFEGKSLWLVEYRTSFAEYKERLSFYIEDNNSWQSFNLSKEKAKKALEKVKSN